MVVWKDSDGTVLYEQSVPYDPNDNTNPEKNLRPVLPSDIIPTNNEDPGEGNTWVWTGWKRGNTVFVPKGEEFPYANAKSIEYTPVFEKQEAAPELTVEKTAKVGDNEAADVAVNDEITYTVVVTNSGNVTVSGITLSDTLVTLNEAAFDLAPAGTKTITYTYTVTQADVDAGKINNTVTATGKDPKDAEVTKSASAEVTTVTAAPALTVTKSASKTADAAVGDEITYTVVVTNSGNVTVTGDRKSVV